MLSLKFISVQNKFSYRLVFEIALIITLVVSISGMVNGASTQFTTIISQTNTVSPTYLITQRGKTFEPNLILFYYLFIFIVFFLIQFLSIFLSELT